MKTDRNILAAFILNLLFSFFEFVGGVFIGSVAISSDAVHDLGDAVSIGVSYFMERKSMKEPDGQYTYGYSRYSVLGALISTVILLAGSLLVIFSSIMRLVEPKAINYDGMIVFAVVGICANICATLFTGGDGSLNQKAVNLHMLEDVLGWIVVLIGALIMRFTGFSLIDPIISVGVSIYIIIRSVESLKEITDLLLDKVPTGINVIAVKKSLLDLNGVADVHHIHIRSLNGHDNVATLHVVCESDVHKIKEAVRDTLKRFGISHVTLELEDFHEQCSDMQCSIKSTGHGHHHHHRH